MKMRKIKSAIQKFKERIVFRRIDSLKSFHFNIINDRSFIKKEEKSSDLVLETKKSSLNFP